MSCQIEDKTAAENFERLLSVCLETLPGRRAGNLDINWKNRLTLTFLGQGNNRGHVFPRPTKVTSALIRRAHGSTDTKFRRANGAATLQNATC